MNKKFYIILVFIVLAFCSSCRIFYESTPDDWNWGFKPKPLTGMRNFPSAKTEYGKGFRDGCASAFNAVAKGLAADMAKGRYDYYRTKKSPDYGTGWFDGLEQCTYIVDWDVL
jgi:hypothetical protein